MTVRTFRNTGAVQMIMRPPPVSPGLRVSSFWIRHEFFPCGSGCELTAKLAHILRGSSHYLSPVHEPRKRRIISCFDALTFFRIQIGSANRTQPLAIRRAKYLHR